MIGCVPKLVISKNRESKTGFSLSVLLAGMWLSGIWYGSSKVACMLDLQDWSLVKSFLYLFVMFQDAMSKKFESLIYIFLNLSHFKAHHIRNHSRWENSTSLKQTPSPNFPDQSIKANTLPISPSTWKMNPPNTLPPHLFPRQPTQVTNEQTQPTQNLYQPRRWSHHPFPTSCNFKSTQNRLFPPGQTRTKKKL